MGDGVMELYEAVAWLEQLAYDAMYEARHSPPEVAESIWSKTQEAIETLRSAASTGNA